MQTKRFIMGTLWLLLFSCAVVHASPEDDQVAAYLQTHDMISLLEVQLEDRIRNAKQSEERNELIEQLSRLYLTQLKSLERDDLYRQIVFNRATSLTKRMDSSSMYELRIELLIEAYIGVEASVELARLELLDSAERAISITQLSSINHKLRTLTSQLDPAVAHLERLSRRSESSRGQEAQPTLAQLRRFRSLAHYYSGWTGYSLAVLKGQHVSSDVFVSFGWLLGSDGDRARLSELNATTLEFEHVARSAIGVALAYAQSEDMSLARSWAKFVVDSERTEIESKQAAEDRLLQILALDRDWTSTYEWMLTIVRVREGESTMSTADSRFLALKSLEAMQSKRVGQGGMSTARRVAKLAIEQLVEQGEIGQVLDLYQRFGTLPLIAESFITNYAQALGELNRAEQAGDSGMYASVASLFAGALKAPDAKRFPAERDDCTLKLAYSEIRSGRPKEAIKACNLLIKKSTKDETIEEARWMRIAALDAINIDAGKASSNAIKEAVREYIVAYPSTARSAKLILQYAMQGTVDTQVAIDTLEAIDSADPIAIPARRTLVGLRYKQLRASRFSDQAGLSDVLDIVRWIDKNQPAEIADLSDAKTRIGTIRIGLDLALRQRPVDIEFAERLLGLGAGLVPYDSSFTVYRGEFVYRQIEISMLENRVSDAMHALAELAQVDERKADSARLLVFNHSLRAWQTRPSKVSAQRIVEVGVKILANQMPAFPEPMDLQVSSIAEMIAESASYLGNISGNTDANGLALRMSLLVLERGQPTEPGLRRTTQLAKQASDHLHELEAWLRLLAAYPSGDERWYEARYESLRVMKDVEFARALSAYDQYKVLHPTLGPAPWNAKIASLFGDPTPDFAPSNGGSP